MGDIGPQRQHFEVLPTRSETHEMRVPEPEPFPVPSPEPIPQPDPVPNPDPVPQPPNGGRG
ncbi:MAG: hypothetical protein QOK11_56 [Pseudonocardiales bacterium]|nr:hypothetical protein [Pseudonocardiales bacterium]